MPHEAWYVLIGCVAIVVVIALWKGRGIVIRRDSIAVDPEQLPRPKQKVLNTTTIERSQFGDVTAERGSSSETAKTVSDSDVLNDSRIRDSKFGDVTGREVQGKPPRKR